MSNIKKFDNSKKIYVAGHTGMVGSAIVRRLKELNFDNLVLRTHDELDLTDQLKVRKFFQDEKIDVVYLAAAKVGGIHANNTYPADFIYKNIMIQTNIIHESFISDVKKLLFLGTSCIYPKNANQPMKENELLTGTLEPTNEPYAIAKISGIKICESYNRQYGKSHGIDYRSIMPTNLFGPGDNYHPENSHVIPALILKFHESKINKYPTVDIWGTGKARREFLYVDDMARAAVHIMSLEKKIYDQNSQPMCSHINVGNGKDITISELAEMIRDVVNYSGQINFDPTKPDGNLRKLMDSSRINNLGWKYDTGLREGLEKTYKNFLITHGSA